MVTVLVWTALAALITPLYSKKMKNINNCVLLLAKVVFVCLFILSITFHLSILVFKQYLNKKATCHAFNVFILIMN